MDKTNATHIFESLSSGIRLDIYRLLVKAGPNGLVTGDIATALALPANNISFHLKTLTQAGLLSVVCCPGRSLSTLPRQYEGDTELIAYLIAECCAGQS
jgi:ArsR family transcriptional regulator